MNLLEHADREFYLNSINVKKAQPNIVDSEEDYINACGKCAYDMLKVFSKAGHSGMSADLTLTLFNKLAKWENISELDNNPKDWEDVSDSCNGYKLYQSKRNSACFSNDGLKTYYNINENIFDSNNRTYYPLKEYKHK